jgi:transcription termination/antitermination protein NusA
MKNDKIIKDSSALGQFSSAIAQICEEKGIDKNRVMETVEAALSAAYKKDYGRKGQLVVAKLDEKTGKVNFKQLKEVVDEKKRNLKSISSDEEEDEEIKKKREERKKEEEKLYKKAKKSAEEVEKDVNPMLGQEVERGEESHIPRFNIQRDILIEDAKKIDKKLEVGDFIEIPLETKSEYGRVASQTAKQVIIQRLREAERDAMYDEYKNKEGEVINGIVQRIEGRNVFVDLGKSVGILFYSNQIPQERYQIGQRIKVYIEKVEADPKGPGITLSRSHPVLLKKLFELEVPEIFTGTVEIKSAAREAGNRSKIAVLSNEEGIDPIGSCVGQKGTRVQAIIDELNGEKIDIIEWSDDIEKLIASALSPAKVISVKISEGNKNAIAYVPEDQLSLAIGRSGQNVRLAAKLTDWKIEVTSHKSTKKNEKEEENDELKKGKEDKKIVKKKATKKGEKKTKIKKTSEEVEDKKEKKVVAKKDKKTDKKDSAKKSKKK